jgi:hypothetical protein
VHEETETSREEIRLQMASVRRRMEHSRRELARLSKARKKWTNYVREAPLLAAGSALLIGYFLVPKKRKAEIPLDAKGTIRPSEDGEVKMIAPKTKTSTGIMKTSLKMAGRSLLHLGMRKIMERAQRHYQEKDADPKNGREETP